MTKLTTLRKPINCLAMPPVGSTVRIHPASDWFMRGITTATVRAIGPVWIHLESSLGHTFRIRRFAIDCHILEITK